MSTISGNIVTNGGLTGTIIPASSPAPVLETATVKSTNVEQTIVPQEGVTGFDEIVVQAVETEDNLPAVMFGTETVIEMSAPDAEHKTYKGLADVTAITLTDATAINANAFTNLAYLQSISAPEVLSVGNSAFSGCFRLASISLPKCTTVGNTAFSSNRLVTNLSLPACTSVGQSAFYGMSNLQSISLPEVLSVGDSAFSNTFNISAQNTSLVLPKCTSVGSEIVRDCNVKSIELTVATSLPENCLYQGNYTSVRLPAVQSIGKRCFDGSRNLTDVYFGYNGVVTLPTLDEWDEYNLFAWEVQTVTIHVPTAQLALDYAADSKWAKVVTETQSHGGSVTFVGDYA